MYALYTILLTYTVYNLVVSDKRPRQLIFRPDEEEEEDHDDDHAPLRSFIIWPKHELSGPLV